MKTICRIKRGFERGFTMVEMLLVLAVLGLLYYSFILNNLGPVRAAAQTTSANSLQAELESSYGSWTALGGTHVGTLTANMANEGMFAYDLLYVLTQPTGVNSPAPPHFTVTSAADGSTAITPPSNTVRMQLAGSISDPGSSGTQGVVYGPFYILAKPTTTSSAVWEVTSTNPPPLL